MVGTSWKKWCGRWRDESIRRGMKGTSRGMKVKESMIERKEKVKKNGEKGPSRESRG